MGVEGLDVFRMGAMVFMGLSRVHDLPRGSSQLNRPVTLLLLSRNLSSATALWYMSAVSADVNQDLQMGHKILPPPRVSSFDEVKCFPNTKLDSSAVIVFALKVVLLVVRRLGFEEHVVKRKCCDARRRLRLSSSAASAAPPNSFLT